MNNGPKKTKYKNFLQHLGKLSEENEYNNDGLIDVYKNKLENETIKELSYFFENLNSFNSFDFLKKINFKECAKKQKCIDKNESLEKMLFLDIFLTIPKNNIKLSEQLKILKFLIDKEREFITTETIYRLMRTASTHAFDSENHPAIMFSLLKNITKNNDFKFSKNLNVINFYNLLKSYDLNNYSMWKKTIFSFFDILKDKKYCFTVDGDDGEFIQHNIVYMYKDFVLDYFLEKKFLTKAFIEKPGIFENTSRIKDIAYKIGNYDTLILIRKYNIFQGNTEASSWQKTSSVFNFKIYDNLKELESGSAFLKKYNSKPEFGGFFGFLGRIKLDKKSFNKILKLDKTIFNDTSIEEFVKDRQYVIATRKKEKSSEVLDHIFIALYKYFDKNSLIKEKKSLMENIKRYGFEKQTAYFEKLELEKSILKTKTNNNFKKTYL